MPTPVQIQAQSQFNQFVLFAQREMDAGNTKSIARLGGEVAGPIAGDGISLRSISVATDDKVYALRRSADAKSANNVTRDLFKKAVADMFGGESRIPKDVLKAMEMKDYKVGKPLTARRIIAVNAAIVEEQNKMRAAISDATAFVAQQDGKKDFSLTSEQQEQAVNLFRNYKACCGGNAKILAANIVRIVTNPDLAPNAEVLVSNIAKRISHFKSFAPGAKSLKDIDAAFLQYHQGFIKDLGQDQKDVTADGISKQFMVDAPRSDYVIAGHTFMMTGSRAADANPANDIADALKDAVPKVSHRKVLSGIMTQDVGNGIVSVMLRAAMPRTTAFPNGKAIHTAKGGDLIAGNDVTDQLYGMPTPNLNHMKFDLEISPDGKTAKLTHTITGTLRFGISGTSGEEQNKAVATLTMTQVYTFDLSKDEPKIVSYHLGQQLDASAVQES